MTNQEIGDPITGLAQRIEKHEHDIQNIYGKLMRAFVGSRIVAGNITGVIPPGIVIGPTLVSMINNSGGSLADGDVVVLDTTSARRVTTTTTAGNGFVVGVVRDVNNVGTFANGSETPIQVDGYIALLHVTGTVTAGDWLRTSTTVKLAVSAGAVPSRGVFARALTADAAGAVEAYVFGGDMSALAQLLTAKGDLIAATAAGIPDNLPVSGNDGFILTEDSGDPFGMSWQAAPAGSTPSSTVEDETTFGISPDAGASAEYSRGDHTHGTPATPTGVFSVETVLQNEIKGWPCLMEIGAGIDLVTLAQWFADVGTPTTKASAVPSSGEAGLDAKFLEVIKCVTDAADEGWRNHRFTYANEPRVKSGAHLSALVWLASTGGGVDCTAKLVNSDASETVGTVVATDGDWDLHYIENHVCAGTYVDFQVTKDTSGTFYAGGRITVMLGETAIMLTPRKGVYRLNAGADTAVENLTGQTTKAVADVDLTSAATPLAFMGDFHLELAEGATGQFAYSVRPNGTSWTLGINTGPAVKAIVEPSDVERMFNDFPMLLDDGQIIETSLANSGGGTVDNARLYLSGWWEWE